MNRRRMFEYRLEAMARAMEDIDGRLLGVEDGLWQAGSDVWTQFSDEGVPTIHLCLHFESCGVELSDVAVRVTAEGLDVSGTASPTFCFDGTTLDGYRVEATCEGYPALDTELISFFSGVTQDVDLVALGDAVCLEICDQHFLPRTLHCHDSDWDGFGHTLDFDLVYGAVAATDGWGAKRTTSGGPNPSGTPPVLVYFMPRAVPLQFKKYTINGGSSVVPPYAALDSLTCPTAPPDPSLTDFAAEFTGVENPLYDPGPRPTSTVTVSYDAP